MKIVIYDLETIINIFTGCFLDYDTKKKKEFVLFDDIEQFYELYKFIRKLKNSDYYMLGFNVLTFDGQIIQFILDNGERWMAEGLTIEEIVTILYNHAQFIINIPEEERFKNILPEYRFDVKHIDLFKQKHYDGKAKMGTSLKWVQFSMRYPNIEEMPINHDTVVTKEMIPDLIKYNWNDVNSTAAFFEKIKFETDLRVTLSEKYGLNLINASEPRMAKEIFGKFLCDEMDITTKELRNKKTFRKEIKVKKIIFPYVDFKTPILNGLLDTLRATVLKPEDKFEKVFKIHNIEVTFGLGGLHSNNNPKIWESKNDWVIKSCDVASMYPNLAIQNNLKPEHLGEAFNKIYGNLYEQRKVIPKKDPINYVFKIILNSTYGLSAEINSYFYDLLFTRAICINGELSLLMLAEEIALQIPECQFIMLNTDGIEVYMPKEREDLYLQICKTWEERTRLILEHNEYKKIALRDVNNYIAIDAKDDVKKKGIFETSMDFHKNPSYLVVPKALEAYFIHGKPYKDFILEHDDIYDFFGAVKKKKNFDIILHSVKDSVPMEEHQQKVTRFYLSLGGGTMMKHFHPDEKNPKGRITSILKDYKVQPCNDLTDLDGWKLKAMFDDINYSYYFKETEKIINGIEGNSNQLSLFF